MAPSPQASAGSSANFGEEFSIAVEEHGWLYALREIGWRRALAFLRQLLTAGFVAGGPTESVKSSEEVTREVVAELDSATAAGDGSETPSRTGSSEAAVAPEPDYERFLALLERREREERETTGTRLRAVRARETMLYGAHLGAAVLTVVLAFLAVGLVLAGLVPVGVASAAVAIIPGSGTVLLRRMWKQERSLRDVLDERRNGHAEIIDAIEGALSVPDPAERSRLATQLAERLQERAFADRQA
jgi:hypothetical protein